MKTWLWSLALAGCVLIAAPAARAAASPTPTPAPNETDLSDFKNNYRGSAKVSVRGVAPYRGRTKIRFTPRAKTAATVTIKAWIESDAGRFRVDDTIAFARNGIVRGKNLAPGVVTRAPFEGTYTATTTSIHFHGTFEFGGSRGVYRGQIARDEFGVLTLTWRILPYLPKSNPNDPDQTGPVAYTYTYVVRAPKETK
jgi:hypothetical protein